MTDRRKLKWLSFGFALYFFLMVYTIYSIVPSLSRQLLPLAAVLNVSVVLGFLIAMRRLYRRIHETEPPRGATDAVAGDRRRLRLLWIGAVLYFLIFLNTLGYLRQLPYQTLILAFIFNGGIAGVFILEIRRVYRRVRETEASSPPNEHESRNKKMGG